MCFEFCSRRIDRRSFAFRRALCVATSTVALSVSSLAFAEPAQELAEPNDRGIITRTRQPMTLTDAEQRELLVLIENLDADAWADRRDAEDELAEKVATSPGFRKAAADALPELDEIRREIVASLLAEAAELAPAPRQAMHFSFLGARAADVVTEINAQSGTDLEFSAALWDAKLTGDIEGLQFWPAVLQLAANHNLDISVSSASATSAQMMLDDRSRVPDKVQLGGPHCIDGPVVVFARGTRMERERYLDKELGSEATVSASAVEHRFSYTFDAFLEPRYWIGSRSFEIEWDEAIDSEGNDLLQRAQAGAADLRSAIDDGLVGGLGGIAPILTQARWTSGRLPMRAELHYPENPGQTLSVRGRIRGLLGTDLTELSVRIDPPRLLGEDGRAEPFRWTIAGVPTRWSVTAVPAGNRMNFEVHGITLQSISSDSDLADLVGSAMSRVRLVDDGGRRIQQNLSPRVRRTDSGEMEMRLVFAADVEVGGTKLICEAPQNAMQLETSFEFKDLPMP